MSDHHHFLGLTVWNFLLFLISSKQPPDTRSNLMTGTNNIGQYDDVQTILHNLLWIPCTCMYKSQHSDICSLCIECIQLLSCDKVMFMLESPLNSCNIKFFVVGEHLSWETMACTPWVGLWRSCTVSVNVQPNPGTAEFSTVSADKGGCKLLWQQCWLLSCTLSSLPIACPFSPHSSTGLPWQAASSWWGLLLCLPNLIWCGRPSSPTCTRPWSIRLVYQQAYDLLPAHCTACLWGSAQLPCCRHGQPNTNITWWLEWTC